MADQTDSTDDRLPDALRGLATIGVVGAGTMGAGIAQVAVEAGFAVVLVDQDPAALDRATGVVAATWARAVAKGRATDAELASWQPRLRTTDRLEDIAESGLVVEAIVENLEAKRTLLREVAPLLTDGSILATNTSSISITALAGASDRPGSVVGMHFFNPVPVMKLVEVVRGERTSTETVERVVAVAERLGKTPVVVQDYPGFVANRVLLPMINEAIFCLQEGVADREAIDTVMRLGMAHPMGPLALADLIGLDVCLSILEILQRDLGDDKYRPAPLLRRLVVAGKLGRKTGEGFFAYPTPAPSGG